MADIFIPGISKDSNSQEAIQKIMDAKKAKLTELESSRDKTKETKKNWNEIKQLTINLQNSSKKLFGFNAPFENKMAVSSNESAFKAQVNKSAEIGEYNLNILKKASSQKIASNQLANNYKIPQGNYSLKIGKETIDIAYSGGTLTDFADQVENKSNGKLKTNVTKNTSTSQILIIEGTKTGENNFINFNNDKTKALFKEMGFFDDIASFDKSFPVKKEYLNRVSSKKSEPTIIEDKLILDRNESYKFNLKEKIKNKEGLVLEVTLKLNNLDKNSNVFTEPTGPNFNKKGEINIFDIPVNGESSILDIPPYKEQEKEQIVEDNHFLDITTQSRKIALDELDVNQTEKKLTFNLPDLLNDDEIIESLIFKNNNTNKQLEIKNIRIYDSTSFAGIKYKNEISKPQDLELDLEGIKIKRESNTVDDAIKGVILQILNPTKQNETLEIKRDNESIVGSITGMLADFNKLVSLVNDQTRVGEAKDESGKFTLDYGLVSLISKLRTIMMNPHKTSYGDELALLAQIGISTNAAGGFQMDKSKLQGILEVNEDVFISKMDQFPQGIKELFGRDNDGDLLIDTGAAFELDRLLKNYTQQGQGFFDTRLASYDNTIQQETKDIVSYKEKMEKEEKDLQKKFYQMEKAIKDLDENTKKFDNFNKQSGR